MEKIKDFFYYVGDFIICILILSVMYFLITWKLEETMPMEAEGAEKIAMESIDEEIEKNKEQKSVLETGLEENKDKEERKNSAIDKNNQESRTSDQSSEGEKKENTDDKKKNNSKVGDKNKEKPKKVVLTVSAGMNAWDIAASLKEKGVIDNSEAFLTKLEEMDLSSSLLAGEFPLETGMDNETIIRILTGQN